MRLRLLAAVLLLAGGCGFGDEPATPPSDTTPSADAQAWLDAHNAVRQNAQPAPPSPLPALTWSTAAASVAQAWADNCSYGHNANRGTRGENVAANAPPGAVLTNPSSVVNAWASEVADYNYASNTCASGKDCGHYTQIVWRDTTRVGCAHRTCSTNSPFGSQYPNWDFWVCDYEPPGNFIGQKPY
jgi:pathogenesis-related protein 1